MPKRIVSISIGSSKRNSMVEVHVLGETFLLERIGTDGSWERAIQLVRELDGKVEAFGLGGADLYVYAGGRRYTFRDARRVAAAAQKTPMVDGSGLKHTLERRAVRILEGELGWQGKRVLVPSAVDRFGLAEALDEAGAQTLYGDLIFGLGLPIPIYRLSLLQKLGYLFLPLITQLPFQWLYPTGEKQEKQVLDWRQRYFSWAQVVAGDWHFIRRFMPERMEGKVILTNTTTEEDLAFLRARGVAKLITTTPRLEGRSFGTNVMEAFIVALAGRYPLSEADYLRYIEQLQLKPEITELQA
ncbi:MAG: quinate 5-dehydrogenase [Meiothermus sp.]|uniref:quinate 5-dehydrogenase n=1 Tax=Meiothermus sp. TaxID=1955249 RepID=UPI0025D498B1|nr:quinate 5-dehydrogenase [Meiothermus sp.]MCS7058200.1 quinate 5-dehydrogenase [Meiothermus sp.]MCS7194422.1 quinate 5-dehydrogenase [Meiothermus sp.]MCX7739460.1 quinate 5-dehydrogenase [Meiothermus sp.]MDW8091098.1 quinate 5-dehydrogenase [Meiothermus sp.]MDW8481366.1 quinate 5-dehydrogenase [Meiothermus sp.]